MKKIVALSHQRIDFSEVENLELDMLAVGGDLRPERLLHAYQRGIFPWYNRYDPICWWSPFPRAVLFPQSIQISASLRRLRNKNYYCYTLDQNFFAVITNCARQPRRQQSGTWIHPEMINAYCRLHELGFAHSLEVYRQNKLVGGLYGVSLGRAFFGESMFNLEPDTARLALWKLCELLSRWEFFFIDCQMLTPLTESMGAVLISKPDFQKLLNLANSFPTKQGKWCENEFFER